MIMQQDAIKVDVLNDVRNVLRDALELGERADRLTAKTQLFGSLPEFDSMAVVSIIHGLEEKFDIEIDGDEIDADTFETVGALTEFVEKKRAST